MAALRPGDDPYRILGVLRGAGIDQIKAAHRRLAMRFHPDRATGDEARFLAVQEAYQLLSDPRRRSDWDRRHAPGPTSAGAPRGATRQTGRGRDAASGDGAGRTSGRPRPAREARAPGQRTATWSAAHVPWWEEFRRGPAGASGRNTGTPSSAAPDAAASTPVPPPGDAFDLDAHSRSSGAAWSAAARRHFRRGDSELPSRGAWRFRGTQVVTGAEARKLAEEETRGSAAGTAPGTGAPGLPPLSDEEP